MSERRDVITIAGTMSLTGRFSEVGQHMARGYRLRAEEIEQGGGILGRPVRVLVEDDRSDPTVANAYYERLLNSGGTHFVLSPYGGIMAEGVAAITERYGVPMLACSVSPNLWTKGRRYLLGVPKTARFFLEGAVDLAAHHGFKRIAIIGEDMEFTRSSAEGSIAMACERGLEIVHHVIYPKGDAQVSARLEAVRASRADVLLVYAFLDESVEMVRHMASNNLDLKLCVFTAGGLVPEFIERLGAAADYILGPTPWEPVDLGYPGAAAFVARYKDGYGSLPSGHTAVAYASLLLLQMGIEAAGNFDREAVKDALFRLDTRTFFGNYRVDSKTGEQIGKTMHMYQNLGGRRRVIWPPHAREVEPVLPQPTWAERKARVVA